MTGGLSRRSVLAAAGLSAAAGAVGIDLASARGAFASVTYQHPLANPWILTQQWGAFEKNSGRFHAGTDYQKSGGSAASAGQPIYSIADGFVRVATTTRDNSWGYYVIIEHADGVFSFYAHMIVPSGLTVGASIARGAQVSTIGNWVNGSPGAYHLHLGMSHTQNGVFAYASTFDPEAYISGTLSQPPTPPDLPKENNMTLAIALSLRVGVGEFYLFASPTQVSLSRELSTLSTADRSFEDGVMRAVALVSGYPAGYNPPLLDDSPNGGWYLRNQVASRVAGMPVDFALSPTNPYTSP